MIEEKALPLVRGARPGIAADRRGAIALEFALIAPVLLLLLFGTIQGGMLIYLRHAMYDTALDTARRVAVAELGEAGGIAHVRARLGDWGDDFAIDVDASNPGNNDVTVAIAIPLASVVFLDPLDLFSGGTMSVDTTMRKEF